ncbi:hypothetical protein [Trichocoleus sp. AS-A2]|uniref:hypothetical protein n=1 Tax=Trichocoleus sp. AS-A2 TaxID=2933922 RepID=UPI003297504E
MVSSSVANDEEFWKFFKTQWGDDTDRETSCFCIQKLLGQFAQLRKNAPLELYPLLFYQTSTTGLG